MLALNLGLAGTAKNTGKTTATFAIMEELRERGIPFYLTSIGYDGENIDNITRLPKPKLRVEVGDVVATAEQALAVSTAKYQVLNKTDIRTPIGKILIVKIVKAGLVVTAGPNKSSEARELIRIINAIGPGIILLDGALSRIAPMVETDGFVLATGASKTPDISRLALETEMVAYISQLPRIPNALNIANKGIRNISMIDDNLNVLKIWSQTSLLKERDVNNILPNTYSDFKYIYIPGIISKEAFQVLSDRLCQYNQPKILVFADPIKLLVANDPIAYQSIIKMLSDNGIFVGVLRRIPMLAVTVNPFYPEYRFESKTYTPAYVDFARLQVAVQNKVNIPVINVIRQGAKGLVDIILANSRKWEAPETVYFN